MAPTPWTYAGKVTTLDAAEGVVTLVDESTFAISARSGDIVPGSAQGLFVRDTRVLSHFELRLDGQRLEGLTVSNPDPFSATFVTRSLPDVGRADSSLLVFRSRYVGQGMREDLSIRNYSNESAVCLVEVLVDADFADLFAVKEGRAIGGDGEFTRTAEGHALTVTCRRGSTHRGVQLRFVTHDPSADGADGSVAVRTVVPRAVVPRHP